MPGLEETENGQDGKNGELGGRRPKSRTDVILNDIAHE